MNILNRKFFCTTKPGWFSWLERRSHRIVTFSLHTRRISEGREFDPHSRHCFLPFFLKPPVNNVMILRAIAREKCAEPSCAYFLTHAHSQPSINSTYSTRLAYYSCTYLSSLILSLYVFVLIPISTLHDRFLEPLPIRQPHYLIHELVPRSFLCPCTYHDAAGRRFHINITQL